MSADGFSDVAMQAPKPVMKAPVEETPAALGPAGSVKMAGEKYYDEFTIPKEAVGCMWDESEFCDDDLKFGMTEITLEQNIKASQFVGASMDVGTAHLQQQVMCIYTIGGKKVARNEDHKKRWMRAIGPGGRQCVDVVWSKLNTVSDKLTEGIFEAGERKRG